MEIVGFDYELFLYIMLIFAFGAAMGGVGELINKWFVK